MVANLHNGVHMFNRFFSGIDQEFIEAARFFGANYLTEDNVSQWCSDGGIPDAVMKAYKDSPLGTMGLAREYGGPDVSLLAQIAALEELTCCAGAIIPMQSQFLSFLIISEFANDRQRAMILERFEETSRPCFSVAISDSVSGSDAAAYETNVARGENGVILLNGEKAFVVNGQYTPYILTIAQDYTSNPKAELTPSCWLLPTSCKGVSTYPLKKIGQSMIPSAAIKFDNVELESEWRVGEKDGSWNQMRLIMNLGRCVVCAGSLGLARAAFRDAAIFANVRTVNGHRIGDFQQIGLLLADMQSELLNMKAHLYNAIDALQTGRDARLALALMKKYVPATAVKVADSAMQIFGGAGYTDSARVGRIWVDARGNQFATGTDQVMANIAARAILKKYAPSM